MRLTQLDGMIAFVAVAKHQSFAKAAVELGVSSPALSQSVRQLESRLGVRLFNRTTRSVALTEAGQAFLARVGPAVADLSDATSALSAYGNRPTGLLRLNAGRVVAATVVREVLPGFRAAYPDVQVEVAIDDGFTDIVSGGFDAGFRLGDSIAQDMVAAPIGPPMQVAVVGTPEYFTSRGLPARVADLRQHELIRYRFPTSGQLYRWEFVIAGEPTVYEPHGGFITNDSTAMIDAALDGLGLAYTFDLAVVEHLRTGRLVRVLQRYSPSYPGFYIYYPGRRQVPLKLRCFIDCAQAVFRR